jgi:UrcA family protein
VNRAIKFRSRMMASMLAASVLVFAGAANFAAAQAWQPGEYLTEKVAYDDLNLDTAAGAKALYARLHYAAKSVCAPAQVAPSDLGRYQIWRTCVDTALASAVRKINNPLLTALHNQRVSVASTG